MAAEWRFFMINIGCHLSVSKGFLNMGKTAKSIDASTFAFFTRNPRGGKAKAVDTKDAAALCDFMKENNFARFVAHSPYTMNACSADEGIRNLARTMMKEDLQTLELLPNNYYNFHPGSHVGQGTQTGIDQISEMLNEVLFPAQQTVVLLETMAGKGSEIGRCFEELKAIIDKVELNDKLGVCLDTCHVYDAGYDIVSDLDKVLEEFDSVIGLDKLKALHLNDSLNPLGSHKDRHAKIGEGHIGISAFEKIVNNKYLKNLPMILETPNELDGYKKEISLLKSLCKA